jgi:ABC-type multidrug transport system fused ATPase/permease subunit
MKLFRVTPYTLEGLVVWIGALATLAIFSFLYKENRAYRFAEHILLGLGVGFGVAVTITDVLVPLWWQPMTKGWQTGHWGAAALGIVAAALGLMWYGLYFKRTVWLARIVIGLTMGAGAGLAFKAEINDKLPQVIASFKSPYVPAAETTTYNNSLNNLLFLIILFAVLSYFFFSFEHRHPTLRASARTGRVFLMITFGVFFGNTIMTRMSVFIERIWFLLTKWLNFGGA